MDKEIPKDIKELPKDTSGPLDERLQRVESGIGGLGKNILESIPLKEDRKSVLGFSIPAMPAMSDTISISN